jgi:hypothetical protein
MSRRFCLCICLLFLSSVRNGIAAHCEGGSHISCAEGIDRSGRSPGALYDAAAEALREAQTPAQAALARKAMRDALNPAMSDPRAVACNGAGGGPQAFQACMAGPGPTPGLQMTMQCQQNLLDGRILVADGRLLPAGAQFKITHYRPNGPYGNGWTRGECEITIQKPDER